MTDSYVQVPTDSTGKKLQTFQNTVGLNTVESEAVTLVNSSGSEIDPRATRALTASDVVSAKQSDTWNMGWRDTTNAVLGFKNVDGKPRISCTPYTYDIAEGNVSGHTAWSKIGYNGALAASTEADVWSKTGLYVFPTTASTMRVVSSSAGDEDTGVIIKTGTSTGGTTTSLIDTTGGVNFNGVVAVEVGDCILLDKANEGGRTPEWGYVTAVTSNTELAVAGGFSSGGVGTGRTYNIVDKVLTATPRTGAQCWRIDYLDANYNSYAELGVFDGNATVATVGTMWRINGFRIIASGTGNVSVGNLTLDNAGGTVYGYITLGFTRVRNAMYTVPTGKTLYIASATLGYAHGHTQPHYCRIITRANVEPKSLFNTGRIFYVYSEIIAVAGSIYQDLPFPLKFPAKTDLKISAIADYAGIATTSLRGWLE